MVHPHEGDVVQLVLACMQLLGLGMEGRDIYLMVATNSWDAGDNQGEYSEQKIEKKSEIKESKDVENGKTEEEKLRKHETIHHPMGKNKWLCPCFLL